MGDDIGMMVTKQKAGFGAPSDSSRRCLRCQNFQMDTNTCAVVEGAVESWTSCNLFERISPADEQTNIANVSIA